MPRWRTATIGIILVIIVTALFHYGGLLSWFDNHTRQVVNFFTTKAYHVSLRTSTPVLPGNNCPTIVTSTNDTGLTIQVQLLQSENAELRKQLNFFASSTYQTVGADVIGRTIDPLGTTIIINAGKEQGIIIGNPVVVSEGKLIGRVARVDAKTALVRLLTDGQSRVAATVLNHDNSLGLIEGGYGLSVRLGFIPQNEVVRPGDTIVSSGLEPGMPRGISIGMVEVVEKKPQEPFQQAVLTPAADLHNITTVSVIVGF